MKSAHPNDSNRLPGGLLTDLYELTMAYGYWKTGKPDQESAFHLFFRRLPFDGGYVIASGLEDCIRFLAGLKFAPEDLEYLASLKGGDGKPLFDREFLRYLGRLRLSLDVDAIPEGTAVFPHEPLVRVCGPILQAQLVESALLNFINFQSLIATKAARICLAANGEPVVEFGMRRAQGIDGALTASRAAYVGGCVGTSNVLAGQRFGIPVMGTHAHSWVMSFENELAAFEAYADALPNNCIFLVDTYDSLQGVRNAVAVGKRLRQHGHRLVGIRVDSGDLAYLSIEARKILDAAGFKDAVIVASNDLDEYLIRSLKLQNAAIGTWGVGTKLVTAFDQPALGGVYKLSAVRNPRGGWTPTLKLSEETAKVTTPGILQVRRFRSAKEFVGDAIYDTTRPLPNQLTVVDPADPTRRKRMSRGSGFEDLLVPVVRQGAPVYNAPTLGAIRTHAQEQLSMLHPGIKRFENPHRYPAGLEAGLHRRKMQLILKMRQRG
ncbi:MAG: nicotinate phosphoribosyltransferase [Verrucomicrobiia bacterium]